jgi:hypothetical protein
MERMKNKREKKKRESIRDLLKRDQQRLYYLRKEPASQLSSSPSEYAELAARWQRNLRCCWVWMVVDDDGLHGYSSSCADKDELQYVHTFLWAYIAMNLALAKSTAVGAPLN